MRNQIILHSDLNCFYASVEMNENPALRGKPIAVCGSTENRHGIVLTASYPAKRRGVKTGAANWQARQVCPGLICVPPHYDLYMKYSRLVRRIYA
ncbi:MAG: DNA polymerase IV, partial [Candidatus Spyradocola sp.]